MIKLLPLFLLVFIFSTIAPAQSLEQLKELPIMGDISGFRTKTKFYILGATSDERKIILNTFKKEKNLGFEVVGDPAIAEVFMNFGELTRMADSTPFRRDYQERDELEVFYYNNDKKKVIVFTDTETLDVKNGMSFSFPNSYNLTNNFFKAFKKMQKK